MTLTLLLFCILNELASLLDLSGLVIIIGSNVSSNSNSAVSLYNS